MNRQVVGAGLLCVMMALVGCVDENSEPAIFVDSGMVVVEDMPDEMDAGARDQGETDPPDEGMNDPDMGEEEDLSVEEDFGSTEDLGQADLGMDMGVEEDMAVDMGDVMYPPVTMDPLGGMDRPADVIIPSTFDNDREVGLMVLLHGYSSFAQQQNSYFGLTRQVEEQDMILVLPNGTMDARSARFWNATDACCNAFRSSVDDVAYLRGLIEEAFQRFRIDRSKVILVGHSNGGFMSYRMACEASDIVTGIFSLAGATYKDVMACQPTHPVHIVQMHGTADATISYNGGSAYPTAPEFPSAEDTVKAWAGYNSCQPELLDRPVGDVANASPLTMTVKGFDGCDPNGSVQLWTIQNGSHIPMLPATFSDVVLDHFAARPRTP